MFRQESSAASGDTGEGVASQQWRQEFRLGSC